MKSYLHFKTLYYIVFIIGYSFLGCQSKSTKHRLAFYHWKQRFDLNAQKVNYLNQVNSNTIYLRFFDVDWNTNSNTAYPISILSIDSHSIAQPLNIIPTVFITNRVFKNIKDDEIDNLANQVSSKINALSENLNNVQIASIQIDCDWSAKTKIPYFKFLTTLKEICQNENKLLTTTIRLHQIKYAQKTGIPPVDRGTLMCYNMGQIENWKTDNSIIATEILKKYISQKIEYDIPLDLALPVFQWGILFRDGRLIKLLNELKSSSLENTAFFKKIDTNRYEVLQNNYLAGHYLYPGDLIRLEKSNPKTLIAVSEYLKDKLPKDSDRDIIFYHLNDELLDQKAETNTLKVFNIFTNKR